MNFVPHKRSVPKSSQVQFMGMKRLIVSVKKWLTISKLCQGQELIASRCFETQLLNSSLQFFYKRNMLEYHYLGVLIIGWSVEAE